MSLNTNPNPNLRGVEGGGVWGCESAIVPENLQLSFCLSIKRTHEFKWYTKTLWPNGMKMLG